MRYAGQGHEISVDLPDRPLRDEDTADLRRAFEAEYDRLFARHIPGAAIEIMSWVVLVSSEENKPERIASAEAQKAITPSGTRTIFDAKLAKMIEVSVYERTDLKQGTPISGPAVIVEDGTSTYISASFDATIDGGRALVLTAKSVE